MFFSSRSRHTRCSRDWSSDVCSSDLIFQQPAYWPVSFRMTPHWHRVSVDRADIFNPATDSTTEGRLTTHGFDLSGMDILTAGTLAKNISFLLVPAAESDAVFGF